MKLGTLLLRDAVISLNQLELGLRTQVLYGGKLGTNLVELGFVDLDTLGGYLADLCDLPAATQDMFDTVTETVTNEFGAERARGYAAFPLGHVDDSDALAIAFVEPPDDDTLDRIAKDCGCAIAAYIAPELRVYYYQERVYGLARKARFVRQGSRRRKPSATEERRRSQPPRGIELPPSVRLEPRASSGAESGHTMAEALRVAVDQSAPQAVQDEISSSMAAAVQAAARAIPPLSFEKACNILETADHRDQIGNTVVAFANGRFEVAVVFLLRDSNALGWRLFAALGHPAEHEIQQLSLPLGGVSALQAAYDTGNPFRGAPPSVGRPIEKRLWDVLETDVPQEMLVVPIKVRQRVVNLVYVHGSGGRTLDEGYADELVRLAERASGAYTRLIQHAKLSVRVTRVE